MKQWVGLLARLVVGGVWVWAGLLKLPDPAASVESVRAYELLPGSLVEPVGYLLPPLEVVVGVALLAGLLTRGAAVISAVLLVAFIIGISHAWASGLTIDCGCFGGGGSSDPDAASQYPWDIARDVGLLAGSALLVWWRRTPFALDAFLLGPGRVVDDLDDPADIVDLESPEDAGDHPTTDVNEGTST